MRTVPPQRYFVKAVHSYWRSNQVAHFSNAVEHVFGIFYPIAKLDDPSNLKSNIEVSISGWASPWALRKLSLKKLIAANPDYSIRVRRWIKRKDVSKVHGVRFAFSGFSIVATGQTEQKFTLHDGVRNFSKVRINEGIVIQESEENSLSLYIESASHQIYPDIDLSILELAVQTPFELTDILSSSGFYEAAEWLATAFKRTTDLDTWVSRWSYLSSLEVSPLDSKWHVAPIVYTYGGIFPGHKNDDPINPPFPKMVLDGDLAIPRSTSESIIEYPQVLTEIRGATVQNGGLTFANGDVVWDDLCGDPRLSRGNEVIRDIYGSPTRGSHVLVRQDPEVSVDFEEAVFIGGRHDFNWFHWIAEYLPSIIHIDSQVDIDTPILISDHVPKQGVQALQLLTKREIRVIPKGKSVRLRKLYKHSPSFGVPDNYIRPWSDSCFGSFQTLSLFKEKVLSNVDRKDGSKPSVFLARFSKHRSLENELQLSKIASDEFGFEYLAADKLSFLDQVNLFHGAERIIGAGGAHMANFMFANPNCRIASMTSSHDYDSPVPALMAQVSGASFIQIVGNPLTSLERCNSLHQAKHSNFEVDTETFRRVLKNQFN